MDDILIKLHPAMVHFPIALLLMAGVFGVFSLFGKKDFWKDLMLKFLITGVIFSPIAVLTGVIEVLHLKHNEAIHKLLTIHQYNGLVILGFYLVLLAWYWIRRNVMTNTEYMPFVFCLFLGCILLLFQGYLGGEMVFGQGAGVKPMEEMMKEGHKHTHDEQSIRKEKHSTEIDSTSNKRELKDMKY